MSHESRVASSQDPPRHGLPAGTGQIPRCARDEESLCAPDRWLVTGDSVTRDY